MTGSNSGSDDSNESRKRHSDDHFESGCSSKRPNCGASAVHLKVLIPSIAAGAVIGKDGEAIERIQKESGAKVKISKRNDFYPDIKFKLGIFDMIVDRGQNAVAATLEVGTRSKAYRYRLCRVLIEREVKTPSLDMTSPVPPITVYVALVVNVFFFSPDLPLGTLERVCLIVGTLEAVTSTHTFVMERIYEKPDTTIQSTDSRVVLERHKQVR
ncbi:RNA-binding protein Nova-1 [Echinococcus granulosus]|uniref:RNA-binding protein Nova-1 n=1 Tax=Echinococcus granulosus TaxID=6210 RepID=W6US16_ECHGR|nr:RNA-binding protein Nova-1 [Echinococcus granulosus]EUB64043.1 RNA-binding protein Nova-1 [Echinococcus granulosus]